MAHAQGADYHTLSLPALTLVPWQGGGSARSPHSYTVPPALGGSRCVQPTPKDSKACPPP